VAWLKLRRFKLRERALIHRIRQRLAQYDIARRESAQCLTGTTRAIGSLGVKMMLSGWAQGPLAQRAEKNLRSRAFTQENNPHPAVRTVRAYLIAKPHTDGAVAWERPHPDVGSHRTAATEQRGGWNASAALSDSHRARASSIEQKSVPGPEVG
jgi:hypothetical protein